MRVIPLWPTRWGQKLNQADAQLLFPTGACLFWYLCEDYAESLLLLVYLTCATLRCLCDRDASAAVTMKGDFLEVLRHIFHGKLWVSTSTVFRYVLRVTVGGAGRGRQVRMMAKQEMISIFFFRENAPGTARPVQRETTIPGAILFLVDTADLSLYSSSGFIWAIKNMKKWTPLVLLSPTGSGLCLKLTSRPTLRNKVELLAALPNGAWSQFALRLRPSPLAAQSPPTNSHSMTSSQTDIFTKLHRFKCLHLERLPSPPSPTCQ